MMYIRTKDGIHSVEAVPLSNGRIRYSLSNEDSLISKEDFEKITIREADTIEELCDEFVIHRKEMNYNFVWNEDRNIGLNYFCSFLEKYDVYGCIWTSKGLIYVAKMNEKGDLELI